MLAMQLYIVSISTLFDVFAAYVVANNQPQPCVTTTCRYHKRTRNTIVQNVESEFDPLANVPLICSRILDFMQIMKIDWRKRGDNYKIWRSILNNMSKRLVITHTDIVAFLCIGNNDVELREVNMWN